MYVPGVLNVAVLDTVPELELKSPMLPGAPVTFAKVMLCGTFVVVLVQVTVEPDEMVIGVGLKTYVPALGD